MFSDDRSLLDCLFQAVHSVVLRMFHNINKSKNFVPGFICVLHTFGRSLEWNPHIHCLISYIYARPNLSDTDTVIKYISRYYDDEFDLYWPVLATVYLLCPPLCGLFYLKVKLRSNFPIIQKRDTGVPLLGWSFLFSFLIIFNCLYHNGYNN